MGLMSRVLETTGSTSSEGLLHRATELRRKVQETVPSVQTAPAPPKPAAKITAVGQKKKALDAVLSDQPLDPERAVTDLLRGLSELPQSIQLPSHLFSLIVSALAVEKAAILLPDYDENLFVPWASTGLDATTLHRFRLPDEDVNTIVKRGPSGVIWEGQDVENLRPYFSRREAGQLNKVLLFAFVTDGSAQAVLMISDTAYFSERTEFLRLILAAVGEPAARVVRWQRLRYSDVIRHAVVFKMDELPIVTEKLAEHAPRGVHLIALHLSDIVSQVATSNDHIDAYRVWQDILRIIASLFASSATVCDLDKNQVLIGLHGSLEDDLDLIVYHIGVTIAELLPEVTDTPVLRYASKDYPNDGADLLQLARSLM